jgi:GMP synthase-like glutamine amidotransferase
MRKAPFKIERIPRKIRAQQLEQFDVEAKSLEAHVAEAKRIARQVLTRDSHILIMDLSGGGFDPAKVEDDDLVRLIQERQFGGGKITHGEILRHMLGFDPNDTRVTIWDVVHDPDRSNLPYPEAFDAWTTTGGPAMPSELHPGNETENTHWLRRGVAAINELKRARVPGVAVCLGSQLTEHEAGADVGPVTPPWRKKPQREFGTVQMQGTPVGRRLQLLYGFWNDEGTVDISASHSEGVRKPSARPNVEVIAFNAYSPHQGFAHPLREGQSVEEADAEDELIVSLQNHPEVLALYLEMLRYLRGEKMQAEGLKPKKMLYRDTPKARKMWHNFIELAGRRTRKRSS